MSTQIANVSDLEFQRTRARFDTPEVAAKYARKKNEHGWRNQREFRLILEALGELPAGSSVLDLPCGTGRVAIGLNQVGYHVTAADASSNMVNVAQGILAERGIENINLRVCDVLDTGFADDSFDVVVCNRLLHHYPNAEVRIAALRELHRISRGPVVAFYFVRTLATPLAWDLRNRLTGRQPRDRVPVARQQLMREAAAAGLRVSQILRVRPLVSPQCYVVFESLG